MDNFIDKALKRKDCMSADDFLLAMADICKEPEVWKKLAEYPQFVQDVIYIIDYDTELQMEGLSGFFSDSTKEHYEQTYMAFMNCGAVEEAGILKAAKEIGFDSDDCYDKYRELELQTAYENDYEAFWNLVISYIEKNK